MARKKPEKESVPPAPTCICGGPLDGSGCFVRNCSRFSVQYLYDRAGQAVAVIEEIKYEHQEFRAGFPLEVMGVIAHEARGTVRFMRPTQLASDYRDKQMLQSMQAEMAALARKHSGLSSAHEALQARHRDLAEDRDRLELSARATERWLADEKSKRQALERRVRTGAKAAAALGAALPVVLVAATVYGHLLPRMAGWWAQQPHANALTLWACLLTLMLTIGLVLLHAGRRNSDALWRWSLMAFAAVTRDPSLQEHLKFLAGSGTTGRGWGKLRAGALTLNEMRDSLGLPPLRSPDRADALMLEGPMLEGRP